MDSYDISGTVGGRGSNGACMVLLSLIWMKLPVMSFLEYVARPQTAEIFLKSPHGLYITVCQFIENNKPDYYIILKTEGTEDIV